MPFVRVSRDRRGYEQIYLLHVATGRGKPSRSRLLYWFRTPPGVIVGREPFDSSVRRALETQNPEVSFDWDKLAKMAAASPDVEPWRERRRAERAARQPRAASEGARVGEATQDDVGEASRLPSLDAGPAPAGRAEGLEVLETGGPGDTSEAAAGASVTGAWPILTPEGNDSGADVLPQVETDPLEDGVPGAEVETDREGVGRAPAESPATVTAASGSDRPKLLGRRRRRRRGGRRRRPSSEFEPASMTIPPNPSKGEEPIG